jgi:hypothetical protein
MKHWYVGPLTRIKETAEDDEFIESDNHFTWSAPIRLMNRSGRLLDLRPYGNMAEIAEGGGLKHFGIVTADANVTNVPNGWMYLGGGRPGQAMLTGQQRARLATASGLNTITSNNLKEAMAEIMVYNSDIEGVLNPKPLTSKNNSNITFSNIFGERASIKIRWNQPEFAHYLEFVKKEYRKVRDESSNNTKHRMWLAHFLDKNRIKRSEYRFFQPSDIEDESPLDPRTPITESFPGNSATLGGDLTWTEYDANFQNTSGVAFKSGSAFGVARCDTDLSGGDMYAQVDKDGGQNGWLDCAIRFASAAETCYWSYTRGGNAANKHERITKRVAGTDTVLTDAIATPYPNSRYNSRFEIIGSDLELLANDETTSRLTVTDTALTSANTYAGISGRDSGGDSFAYDWEADIFASASIVPLIMSYARMRNA